MMFTHDRKKIYGVLFVLTMQFSLCGMTKEQAIGLSVVAGAIPAALMGQHTDNPKVLATAFLLPAALVYQGAKRYTPGYILGQIRNVVEGPVSHDPLASGNKCFFELEGDLFRKKIGESKLYQEGIKEKSYPIIIARDKLDDFQESLSQVEKLLAYAKANAYKDEGLKALWIRFDDNRTNYSTNIATAIGRITELPGYADMNRAYNDLKDQREQRGIDKQNAATNMVKAAAAVKTAEAKHKEAKALESAVWLGYFDFFFGWLFRSNRK